MQFWQVGSSATLGVNSHFVGHIFAMVSITANTNATIQGQLLARNGAVTLDNNTITNGICAETPVEPVIPVEPEPVIPVEPEPVIPVEPEPVIPEVPEVPEVVTTTVTGGQLPKTSTNSFILILIGGSLILLGTIVWAKRKRYE